MPELTNNLRYAIAVCDDQPTDREMISNMVAQFLRQDNLLCDITTFDSGEALLSAIHGGAVFQILLLDVIMGDLDGMALAATLRELGDQTAIVFISAHQEWALQGYEVSAARFIAKPIIPEKLREALLYCVKALDKHRTITLPTAEGVRRVALADIIYAETWGRGIMLTLTSGKIESKTPISKLAELVPEQTFIFCHRAYYVNLTHTAALRYCEMHMDNGDLLPVSKHRYGQVKARFESLN